MKHTRGFTLIELLVVIAVIGVLASVILVSLNSARAKARDAQRLSDLHQIQTALEYYYDDHNAYPVTGTTMPTWRGGGSCSAFGTYTTSGPTGYIPDLAPTYIPILPLDPKPVNNFSCYLYASNGTDYMFLVNRTVEGVPIPSLQRPNQPVGQPTYATYTPGAAGW